MTPPVSIRDADTSDRAFLVESLARLQDHEIALHATRRAADAELCAAYVDSVWTRARENGGAVLIALAGGVRAGFACFWIERAASMLETEDSNTFGYVSDLFVAESARGRGVAKRLLAEAQARLRSHGAVTRLRICTLSNNALAVAAYESAGFNRYEITNEKTIR